MLTSFLLATALAAPVNASVADSAGAGFSNPLRGIMGEVIGDTEDFTTAVGGNFANPFELNSMRLVQRHVYEVTLTNTGTGWEEMFLVAVPPPSPGRKPLLVAFHGYSSSPYSILYQTDYLEKARGRGWWAIAPLGAHQYNYGIDYAMDNIEAAITWITEHANIDPDRIYGVGFSMGGGVAAAYAAQHLDPRKPRFAAVVNHTGTVSMRDVFNNANATGILEDPLMFGGSPDEFPFAYAKASTIDYDLFTDTIDQGNDLARNLKYVAVKNWAVAGDPQDHLVAQAGLLHGQVELRGGTSNLQVGAGSVHTWDSLSERQVLNYLQSQVRQDPVPGTKTKTLVHRDGRFYHFDVTQRLDDRFSSFDWRIMSGINRIFLEKVTNLDHILFNAENANLQHDEPLEVIVQATESESLTIEVGGFMNPPTNVTRDSVATTNWSWNSQHHCLTLIEDDPSSYRLWTIEP